MRAPGEIQMHRQEVVGQGGQVGVKCLSAYREACQQKQRAEK